MFASVALKAALTEVLFSKVNRKNEVGAQSSNSAVSQILAVPLYFVYPVSYSFTALEACKTSV